MGNAVRDTFISMFISSNLHSETTVPALGSTHPHTFVLYKNSEKKKKQLLTLQHYCISSNLIAKKTS